MEKVETKRSLCDLGVTVSLMLYSLLHKLYLGLLQPIPFSLQLADCSEMQPLDKLENVSVKIRDIWVLEDFIMADMTETDDAQIILGRPFKARAGCHIDVKRGRTTFEVQECYTNPVIWRGKWFLLILPCQMHFPFLLRLTWRMF